MVSDDPETEARLREAAEGDERALHWLLERHRPRLRRMIAVRFDERLASRLDPSDVVQETLVDAARKLGDYLRERPLPFYPWLHRLASERLAQAHRYHLHSRRREAGRDRSGVRPWGVGSALRLVDLLATSGTSPSKHLIREEERQQITCALNELADEDREILVMRYLDQLAFGEIAVILDISEGAARVRHFRSLQRLRPLLEGPNEVGEP
ncbi:sigma-70 family RNA polymerase sigma factor [Singulisphaera sp. Ch08]|uniref:Sigma-70 family RNA polymerase sigma factor n=1 Tax=Singulisphaera sp. Ch08 TaxID=3120278 RepID=A0AAU7CTU2_9BACT